MIYVFDTSTLIKMFNNISQNQFPSFWQKFNSCILDTQIISVKEVYQEILRYDDLLQKWAKQNKQIFKIPTLEDFQFVSEIFLKKKFQELIEMKKIISEREEPVADPFIIAKAKITPGCVVTEEKYRENGAKIPNVCEHFNIECTNLDGFMGRENWIF